MRSINIKDISRLADCSVTTVSRVLNAPETVKADTRNRVLSVVQKYNYVPNNSARNLKRIQSSTICVLVKGITNQFLTEMLGIIQNRCLHYHYSVILQQLNADDNEIDVAIEQEKEKRLLGVIVLGGALNNDRGQFRNLSVPIVLVTSDIAVNLKSDEFSSLSIDDRKAAADAVDYLCSLGHKKIGLIVSERSDNSIMQQRLIGYEEALEKNGIGYSEEYIVNSTSFSLSGGYSAYGVFNDRGVSPTAVFCISDTLAIGCAKAVLDSGKRIPEDVSVMGFDGLDITRFYNPVLVSVGQPYRQMAYESVEVMHDLLSGKPNSHKKFEAEILGGKSVRAL